MNINNFNFKNYLKCNNYYTLEQINLKKDFSSTTMSTKETKTILSKMFDKKGESLIKENTFDKINFENYKIKFKKWINSFNINCLFEQKYCFNYKLHNFECTYDCIIEDDISINFFKLVATTKNSLYKQLGKKNIFILSKNSKLFGNYDQCEISNISFEKLPFLLDLHFYKAIYENSNYYNQYKKINYFIVTLDACSNNYFYLINFENSLNVYNKCFIEKLFKITNHTYDACQADNCSNNQCIFFNICTKQKNLNILEEKEYINYIKLSEQINKIEYPIYYLDFESYTSIYPRFDNEVPYSQHVFMYCLIIEHKNNKELIYKHFIAPDNIKDYRYHLFKKLTEDICLPGTILVYNDVFEKTRISEASKMFPDLKDKLSNINDNIVDLLYILKGNKSNNKNNYIYNNYYNTLQNGSYSIKNVLPTMSNLNYKNLNISNGTEASLSYSSFHLLSEDELDQAKENLITYCNQDCYAMHLILHTLKNKIKRGC